MKITTEPGKGGRLYVYRDGEYVMSVDPDTWYSLGYYDGTDITPEEFDELKSLIDNRLAYSQALRFLTLRAHSSRELYVKLLKKHKSDAAQYAVDKCRELGFIDDSDFAQQFANELAVNKHYGPSRIKNELYAKGISGDIINDVISELDIDFIESIKAVIDKKYYVEIFDEKGRRKTIAALMRLGFEYGDIRTALDDYPATEDDEDEY